VIEKLINKTKKTRNKDDDAQTLQALVRQSLDGNICLRTRQKIDADEVIKSLLILPAAHPADSLLPQQ
jgi:hypothetical protein